MKTYKLEIAEHTLDYLFNEIAARCKQARKSYDDGSIDSSATRARLLADSANELAVILTQIARTIEE